MQLERVGAHGIIGAIAALAAIASVPRPPSAIELTPPPLATTITAPTALATAEPAPPPPPPTALPAHRAPRGACPPPRRDAPMVTLPELGASMLEHVVPGPTNPRWLAVWGGDTDLLISHDAGATFTRVTGGDSEPGLEPGATIDDVTFDCYGRALILASSRLGIYEAGTLTWLYDYRDPFAGIRRTLIGGGPGIAIAYHDDRRIEIEVSDDLGATWSRHVVHSSIDGHVRARGQQAADGAIRVRFDVDVTGGHEGFDVVVRGGELRVGSTTSTSGPVEAYGSIELTTDVHGVLWRSDTAAWRRVEGLPAPGDRGALLVPGPWPSVVVGDALYRIARGTAHRVIAWPAEEGRTSTEPATTDLAGRVWAIESHDGGSCDGSFEPILLGRIRS
jgi:hypothetical protein